MALVTRVTDSRAFTINLSTAPAPDECSVLITLVDELGNPLEGACVILNGYSGVTDHIGTHLFTGLALKTYGWSVSLAGYVTQRGQVECTEAGTYGVPVTLMAGIEIPWVIPASLIVGLFLFLIGSKT